MQPRDLIDTLQHLKFEDAFCRVEIDAAARDYLVAALTDVRRR
jgi:hypothetical protein